MSLDHYSDKSAVHSLESRGNIMSIDREYYNYVINTIKNKKYNDYAELSTLISRFAEYPFCTITLEQIKSLLLCVYTVNTSEEKLTLIDTCLNLNDIEIILENDSNVVKEIINIYFDSLSKCSWNINSIINFIKIIIDFITDYDDLAEKILYSLDDKSIIKILLEIETIRDNSKFHKYSDKINKYLKIKRRVFDISPFLMLMNPNSEKYFDYSDIKISYLSSIEDILIDNNWQIPYCMKKDVEEGIISQREADILTEGYKKLKDDSITLEERLGYYKELCNGDDPITLIFKIF